MIGRPSNPEAPVTLPRTDLFRLVTLTRPDDKLAPALRAFLRRAGLPHVFDELLWPALHEGNTLAVAALRDRPWPPWGLGAVSVSALTVCHPIHEARAGVGGVIAVPEEVASVGLLAAVHREAVAKLAERGVTALQHVVRAHTFLAVRVLAGAGFVDHKHPVVTDDAAYRLHEAPVAAHLAALGLADRTPLQLLAEEFAPAAFDRLALYLLAVGQQFALHWTDAVRAAEVIPHTALARVAECLPPGGPPKAEPPVRPI